MGNEKESQSERKQGRSVSFGPVLSSAIFLLLAVFLSVAAVGLLAFYGFGNILATPREVADLRQESLSLQQTMTVLQDRQVQLEQGGGSSATKVAALEKDMRDFEQQAKDLVLLSGDLQENISEVATIQAESEEGRLAIVVMATVQAEREERLVQIETGLNDLQERTNRLFRFVERLNDLTGQTENGLELPDQSPEGTPVTLAPTKSPTPPPTPSAKTTPGTRGENGQTSDMSTNNT